jgi:hypothetical protein
MRLDVVLWLFPPIVQSIAAVLMQRRHAAQRFRWFFAYTVFAVIAETIKFYLYIRDAHGWAYFNVAWSAEAIYAVLGFLAIHEVFQQVFTNFYALSWFKFSLPAVTLVMFAIAISIPLTRPPVQTDPLLTGIFVAQIVVRCLQLGIFFLIFLLAKVFNLYYRQYAFGIAAGFGIAAMGILASTLVRSHYGLAHLNFSKILIPMSYCVAVCVWLVSFIRPEATDPFHDFQHLFTPELFLRQLQRYRQEIKEVLKRWALTFYCFLR